MWNNLTRADIEHAKEELNLRREAIMRRHAEEIRGLDSEQAGIETLDRLVEAMVEKLSKLKATASLSPVILTERVSEPPASGDTEPPKPADTAEELEAAADADAPAGRVLDYRHFAA